MMAPRSRARDPDSVKQACCWSKHRCEGLPRQGAFASQDCLHASDIHARHTPASGTGMCFMQWWTHQSSQDTRQGRCSAPCTPDTLTVDPAPGHLVEHVAVGAQRQHEPHHPSLLAGQDVCPL